MKNNNELKETNIKKFTCYHFDDTVNINDIDLNNILIDEKSYENILIYDVSYKTLYNVKPLRIIFNKVDEYIKKMTKLNKFVLFQSEKYERLFERIRYNLL